MVKPNSICGIALRSFLLGHIWYPNARHLFCNIVSCLKLQAACGSWNWQIRATCRIGFIPHCATPFFSSQIAVDDLTGFLDPCGKGTGPEVNQPIKAAYGKILTIWAKRDAIDPIRARF
jgi:hypothetical protein